MMRCGDPKCRREFKASVAWQIHCSRACADKVRHRRAYARRGPRRPSRRYYRMFLTLIESAAAIRRMRSVDAAR
jgi:hypothetical protein